MTSKKQTTKIEEEVYIKRYYPEAKGYDMLEGVYLAFDGFDLVLFIPKKLYDEMNIAKQGCGVFGFGGKDIIRIISINFNITMVFL